MKKETDSLKKLKEDAKNWLNIYKKLLIELDWNHKLNSIKFAKKVKK